LNVIFYYSGFLSNLRYPEKQSCSFRYFDQLALVLKTEFALKFFKPEGLPPRPPAFYAYGPMVERMKTLYFILLGK